MLICGYLTFVARRTTVYLYVGNPSSERNGKTNYESFRDAVVKLVDITTGICDIGAVNGLLKSETSSCAGSLSRNFDIKQDVKKCPHHHLIYCKMERSCLPCPACTGRSLDLVV